MHEYLGLDVHGATLGLIGHGQIARAVARRARGFDTRVLHHSRTSPDSVPLAPLVAESDIASLHVPHTPQTHHLIGAEELAAMKPTATLVNTARGGVVDEAALLDAVTRRAWTSSTGNRWSRTSPR
ncbi:2-hydroxyacid dehydrogenase [Streptomyces niveiscabiei]|uniref:2-hydroxyacid dehydrogenase n=1 Tax=Streptomyces niveiscabiei TaxID=164115 RepID=UPI000B2E1575